MADLTRGGRLQIMLTKEELEALDNWRFQKRMPSRAAAIRELLKRGLTAAAAARISGLPANPQPRRPATPDSGCFSPGFPLKRAPLGWPGRTCRGDP